MSSKTETEPLFFRAWTDENDHAGPVVAQVDRSPRRGTRAGVLGLVAAVAATTVSVLLSVDANADPSANTWYRLRMCESSNNYRINTGNDHYGAYQFDLGTWRSVGGSGYPNLASAAEQDARALILYRLRGWQPWQCAAILGLREDSDARSGRTSDISVTTGASTSSSNFPSSGYFTVGDSSSVIASFQKQLARRGADFSGTGQFGAKTLAAVKQLQQLNGLAVTGHLDARTWKLAWNGRFGATATPAPKPTPKPKPKPIPVPTAPTVPNVPVFTSARVLHYGDNNATIATFQKQMAKRGAPLIGTGQFGPLTRQVINRLQAANGFRPTGRLGPRVFRLAWTGKY